MKLLLCDHAKQCKHVCKHAWPHEKYGKYCTKYYNCVYVKAGDKTVCKPLKEKEEKP